MNATQEVKVISTEPYKPWSKKLAEMLVGSKMLIDKKSAISVRGIISHRMKIYYPGMLFTTQKIKVELDNAEEEVIEVTRTA